jgi:hypothetical protein
MTLRAVRPCQVSLMAAVFLNSPFKPKTQVTPSDGARVFDPQQFRVAMVKQYFTDFGVAFMLRLTEPRSGTGKANSVFKFSAEIFVASALWLFCFYR